jgi:hypothetical protein
MRHIARGAFIGAVAAIIGALGSILAYEEMLRCPTEDSCSPQYEDGRWTIVEVTP